MKEMILMIQIQISQRMIEKLFWNTMFKKTCSNADTGKTGVNTECFGFKK